MNNRQFSNLLDKYSKGICTPEEIAIINKWYSQYQSDDDILYSFPDKRRELIKSRILNKILHDISEQEINFRKPIYTQKWFKWCVAALIIVVFGAGLTSIFIVKSFNKQEIEIVNNTGNIIKQILPDKSIVWLSPNASIKFPQKFEDEVRGLDMHGECFFEITKNPKRPFIIHSKHLVTKVWGTKFKVSDSDETLISEVTVVSGKVSVSMKGSKASEAGGKLVDGEVILTPKQKVLFETKSKTLNANRSADISSLKIYEHINMVFENATLIDIVSELNAKFNCNILIKNKQLGDKVMNADLTNLNLPEVLEVLKTSLNLNYELKNNQILLKTNY
jgi:ferric-dicitrate binding protein FerR (iron transport regulator)